MNKNAKTILSIVSVAAVGVALGMLLSPAKTVKDSVKGSIDDLGDKVDDLIDTGKEKIMDASDELKARTNKIKREAKSRVDHFGNGSI